MKPLSYTQISLYQSCPLCYKLQYIDKLKGPEKGFFSFGTTMHDCVERFFRVKVPPCPSLEELLQFYEESWLSDGYETPEQEANYKEFGKEILGKFWDLHAPDFRIPIALEHRFFLDVEGIKVMGYIDRVDKLDSGGLSIIDYKTNQELFTNEYLQNNLQLTIYQLAAEQTWNLPVENLTLYHLRTNTPCSCPPRGKTQLDEARRLVLDTAEKILKEEFPATEHQYCPCDFPQYCPYYRHKTLTTPSSEEEESPPVSAVHAAEAVDRYAALQAQIKELEVQLGAVRDIIIRYCQTQDLKRVFGKDNEATYRLVEKTGYTAEDIRSILEPSGLWARALSFDQALLKQLLEDRSIPEDIRQKIAAAKRVTSSYPQLWLKSRAADDEE